MAERITKAQILREARRVYGSDLRPADLFLQPRELGWEVKLFAGSHLMLLVRAASSDEARRMCLAALKAAGDAR